MRGAPFPRKQPRKDPWRGNKASACKSVLSFPLPVSLGFGLTLFQGLFLLPALLPSEWSRLPLFAEPLVERSPFHKLAISFVT